MNTTHFAGILVRLALDGTVKSVSAYDQPIRRSPMDLHCIGVDELALESPMGRLERFRLGDDDRRYLGRLCQDLFERSRDPEGQSAVRADVMDYAQTALEMGGYRVPMPSWFELRHQGAVTDKPDVFELKYVPSKQPPPLPQMPEWETSVALVREVGGKAHAKA